MNTKKGVLAGGDGKRGVRDYRGGRAGLTKDNTPFLGRHQAKGSLLGHLESKVPRGLKRDLLKAVMGKVERNCCRRLTKSHPKESAGLSIAGKGGVSRTIIGGVWS